MANFCIRCGNPLALGFPICPRCGLDANKSQDIPLVTRDTGPSTTPKSRRARRVPFDDSHLPLYGVEQWPAEGIPEGALDPSPKE